MHIQTKIGLAAYNTFHFDAVADFFVEVFSIEDVQKLRLNPLWQHQKKLILWWGSNILLTSDFHGLVIKNSLMGRSITFSSDTYDYVRVCSGEEWHHFVLWACSQWYTWLENLSFIPGTVGGAPMQNIGAYGAEVSTYIHSVEYIDLVTGDYCTLSAQDCAFGYRDSIFKHDLKDKSFITAVVFDLAKIQGRYKPNMGYKDVQQYIADHNMVIDTLTPYDFALIIQKIRQSKLPDWNTIGTAWSFFKNPLISLDKYNHLLEKHPTLVGHSHHWMIKLSAGQLIELSWLKGLRQGAVGTYDNHALVLVHYGGGDGSDIVQLAKYIQDTVYQKFSVHLEPEVNYI